MSARFHFGLQPLLERRRRIEEEQRQRYAARGREFEENAREIDWLTETLGAAMTQSPLVVQLACVDAAIHMRRCRATRLEAELERARQALVVASRERRVIEKLLERLRRGYEMQRARREEQEIEEANRSRPSLRVRSGQALNSG